MTESSPAFFTFALQSFSVSVAPDNLLEGVGGLLLSQNHPDTWVKPGRTPQKTTRWTESLRHSASSCLPVCSVCVVTVEKPHPSLLLALLLSFIVILIDSGVLCRFHPLPHSSPTQDQLLLAEGLFVVVAVPVGATAAITPLRASVRAPMLPTRQSVTGTTPSHRVT